MRLTMSLTEEYNFLEIYAPVFIQRGMEEMGDLPQKKNSNWHCMDALPVFPLSSPHFHSSFLSDHSNPFLLFQSSLTVTHRSSTKYINEKHVAGLHCGLQPSQDTISSSLNFLSQK